MPQATTTIVAGTPASAVTHSALDYIVALGSLALPITAIFALLGLGLVALRLIEIDFGVGKVVMKVRRPGKLPPLDTPAIRVEGVVENVVPQASATLLIDAQAGPAEAPKDEAGDSDPTYHGWDYIVARTVEALDSHWEGWKKSMNADHSEFWETDYRKRRANYGADHGREAMRQLALDQPTWAYPHAVLIDWSREDHDHQTAEGHLAAGLTRQASPQFGHVLSAGVTLRFQTNGLSAALAFCVTWSKAQIPERMKAGAFHTLADLLKEAGNREGYRIAYEWAVLIHPSERLQAFALAYDYADGSTHWAPAMATYQAIAGRGDNGAVSHNNLAILLGHFDKAAQIESYEQGIAGGDKFATANLAKLLIDDGYITAGERLLATVAEPGSSAELHARASSAALAARRRLDDRQNEIATLVRGQTDLYRAAIARSLRHLQSGGEKAAGFYVSEDGLTQLFIGPSEAQCRIRIGERNYSAVCTWQASCYAGKLGMDQGGFFSGTFDVTLVDGGGGLVSLILWPASIGTDQSLTIRECHHCPAEPPPLPAPQVPTEPVLGTLLGLAQIGKS